MIYTVLCCCFFIVFSDIILLLVLFRVFQDLGLVMVVSICHLVLVHFHLVSLLPRLTSMMVDLVHVCTSFYILIWKSTLNLLIFLNGIIHLPFLELSIIVFRDIKIGTGREQYRAWSYCMKVQACQVLCSLQRLISFGSSRLAKANHFLF